MPNGVETCPSGFGFSFAEYRAWDRPGPNALVDVMVAIEDRYKNGVDFVTKALGAVASNSVGESYSLDKGEFLQHFGKRSWIFGKKMLFSVLPRRRCWSSNLTPNYLVLSLPTFFVVKSARISS